MTLPFENDTSRIVKKYAKHSISQSRVKTFLSVLTIALAVALLSGFALSVIGMETEAKRELLVSSQMLYHNLNDDRCRPCGMMKEFRIQRYICRRPIRRLKTIW